MKKLLPLTLSLMIIVACAPDSGRVAEAKYSPASSYWVAGTNGYCTGSGSSRTCTQGIPGHMQFDPESWQLRLMDGHDDGWIDVDEATFHKCPVEKHYPECAR